MVRLKQDVYDDDDDDDLDAYEESPPMEEEPFMRVAPSAVWHAAEIKQPAAEIQSDGGDAKARFWSDPALSGERENAEKEKEKEEMSDEVWRDMQAVLSGKQLRPSAASLAHATGKSEEDAVATAEAAWAGSEPPKQ